MFFKCFFRFFDFFFRKSLLGFFESFLRFRLLLRPFGCVLQSERR